MAENIRTTPGNEEGRVTTADLAGADRTRPTPFGAEAMPSGTEQAPESELHLFPPTDAQTLRRRWEAIQASFVDEPRRSVEDADVLVAGAMKQLAEIFAEERSGLERQWDRGDDVSTEDLRIALKRYRAFFDRLLNV